MANLDALMTSGRTGETERDEWGTPLWLFDLLNEEFIFDLDAAATENNALLPWFFTKKDDGLAQNWRGNVFVNPPYSQLKKWVKKGYEEANKGWASVVMLMAARTDTRAWWDYARWGEVRFLPGRLKFDGGKYSAPFPSAVVIFRPFFRQQREPTTLYWDIREPKG